jgi:DNA-binding LytR/AlgR family response regulator
MGCIEKYLPEHEFVRIHRSYVVNLQMIDSLTRTEVTMDDNAILPIGKTYRQNLFGRFKLLGTNKTEPDSTDTKTGGRA